MANLYGSTPSELYGSTSADSLYSTPADSKEDDGFATYQPFEMNASANDGSDAQDSQNEVDIANDGFDTYTPFGNEGHSFLFFFSLFPSRSLKLYTKTLKTLCKIHTWRYFSYIFSSICRLTCLFHLAHLIFEDLNI